MNAAPDWNRILATCLRGSAEAWRELITHSYPLLLRVFASRVPPDAIEDHLQGFFLSLLEDDARRLRAFDPDRGVPLPAYLRVLAVRYWIGWMRSRRQTAQSREIALDELAKELSFEAPQERRLARREIAEAVGDLPAQQRTAVELHLEGLQVKEIAASLGITPGGTSALLWRAREGLRVHLQGGWSDGREEVAE